MTSLIGILSLLSALTTTSSALWCTHCLSISSSTCTGDSKSCPSGSLCGSTYQKHFNIPRQSSIPNGVICRSCVSEESTWCYTSDTIQCTGDENMCLLKTTELTGSVSTAMRGCATKSYCDLSSQSYNTGGSTTNVTITCTSGSISAHKVVLTPTILCLLLLKLFL
ncbi:urokinase plasminogen activator surface receptor-like [Eleutherodactylus coqui]|uniref:urokinase plasminogen activator surface receptor-like n=1 Tax=Eleutherodactylus coqui TaxID=57060 RepID=UPI003462E4F6